MSFNESKEIIGTSRNFGKPLILNLLPAAGKIKSILNYIFDSCFFDFLSISLITEDSFSNSGKYNCKFWNI